MRRAVVILLAGLTLGGCTHPWRSPEAMAKFQADHYGHLAQVYPAGMTREQVLEITRGRHVATISLPMDDDARRAHADTEIAVDLPIFTQAAALTSGVEPALVDVLEFFGGASGFGVEARYIFYDDHRRVLAAFGSPWAR